MRFGLGASRRRRRAWFISIGVVVLAAAALTTVLLTGQDKATPKTAASTVSVVKRGTVAVTASAAGTIQAAATRGLSFSMTGTVTELDVKAGDTVTAGQVLAKIDNTDAQTAVDTAQTQVNSAQDALTKAESTASATPTTASGGSCQLAGYTSSSPSPSSTPTTSPTVSPTTSPRASTSPKASSTGRTGTGGSTGGGSTSRSTCGTSTGGGSTGGGSTGGGSTGGGSTGGGSTGGSRTGGGSTTDSVFSAQQQLNNAELALQQAQQKLAGTVITAPIAGKVLSVAGVVGSTESPGSSGFIVLGGVSDTEVTASFTESDVAHLAVGQPTSITLPDRTGQPYTGKVSQVSPVGTTSGQLVRYAVLIAFDQVPADLLFGQSANVAVTTQSVSDVLYVSSSAVTGIQNGTGTVTVRSGGHDQQVAVHIGLRGDQYTEIQSGLTQGQSVVTGGG
jgi:HlyD family secretion protein